MINPQWRTPKVLSFTEVPQLFLNYSGPIYVHKSSLDRFFFLFENLSKYKFPSLSQTEEYYFIIWQVLIFFF